MKVRNRGKKNQDGGAAPWCTGADCTKDKECGYGGSAGDKYVYIYIYVSI